MPRYSSDDSDPRSSRRNDSRRRRNSSSSASSDSDRSRRKHKSNSSSRSSSHSRHRRKHSLRHRSRDSPKSRRHGSRSPIRRKDRSRKTSRSRSRTRSRSHSRSRRRHYSRSRSRSSSKSNSLMSSKGPELERYGDKNNEPKHYKDEDEFKNKIHQMVKASGNNNSTPEPKPKTVTVEDVVEARSFLDNLAFTKAVESINEPSFAPQSFVSGKQTSKQMTPIEAASSSHDDAIFGGNSSLTVSQPFGKQNSMLAIDWRKDPSNLFHENFLEESNIKMERWKKKLYVLRRRKLNGDFGLF